MTCCAALSSRGHHHRKNAPAIFHTSLHAREASILALDVVRLGRRVAICGCGDGRGGAVGKVAAVAARWRQICGDAWRGEAGDAAAAATAARARIEISVGHHGTPGGSTLGARRVAVVGVTMTCNVCVCLCVILHKTCLFNITDVAASS